MKDINAIDTTAATLRDVAEIARAAGLRLLTRFSAHARPRGRQDMFTAGHANEDASLQGLRQALATVLPDARWLEEEDEARPLPAGPWWVVDAVEGNVNHVHGMPDWGVSITLVRDGEPVLAAFHQPVGDHLWTALREGGAWLDGKPLQASGKTEMDAAIAATGQAEVGQTETHERMGRSIAAMLGHALMVSASVPSTFPMLRVAAGQVDVFWQYAPVLPGVAAGALFVRESGGVVTRVNGSPWAPGAPDILVSARALHPEAVHVLSRA